MEKHRHSHRLEIAKEPTGDELQEHMNTVADLLSFLQKKIADNEKKIIDNPTFELESEIAIDKKEVSVLQKELTNLHRAFDAVVHKHGHRDRQTHTSDRKHGPWSDPYVGGRNGIGRK